MATLFPSFVSEDDNVNLMEELSKEEIQEVLQTFKKDKIPNSDKWHVEFFLGFYELLEEDPLRVIEYLELLEICWFLLTPLS